MTWCNTVCRCWFLLWWVLLCVVFAHGLLLFGLDVWGIWGWFVVFPIVGLVFVVRQGLFVCLCFVALWYGSRLITDCCKDCSLGLGLLVCCFTLFVLLSGCIRTLVGCLLVSICGLLL